MSSRASDATENMTTQDTVTTRLSVLQRRLKTRGSQLDELLNRPPHRESTETIIAINHLRAERMDATERIRQWGFMVIVVQIAILVPLAMLLRHQGPWIKPKSPSAPPLVSEVVDAKLETRSATLAVERQDAGVAPEPPCHPGAPCEPWLIQSLPYSDANNTRRSEVRVIDQYSCNPNQDLSGPEVWYLLTLHEAGPLVVQLEEDRRDGMNVDLHLLADRSEDSCIPHKRFWRRSKNQVIKRWKRWRLPPGAYYLVVDTRQGKGFYKLSVGRRLEDL